MALDDRITGVSWKTAPSAGEDEALLHLESRSEPGRFTRSMVLLDPPETKNDLLCLVDKCIWGTGDMVMLGDRRIARRMGYGALRLDDGWREVAAESEATSPGGERNR